MSEMDATDHRLIAALRHNARASLSSLAAELGLSRTAIRARMERLQRDGVILGYSVVLKADIERSAVRGITFLRIEGRGMDRVQRTLHGMPEVQALHTTNGAWDLVIELGTDRLEGLELALARIRRIEGVANTETNLLLATHRSTRAG